MKWWKWWRWRHFQIIFELFFVTKQEKGQINQSFKPAACLDLSPLLSAATYFSKHRKSFVSGFDAVSGFTRPSRGVVRRDAGSLRPESKKCSHHSDPLFDSRRAWRSHTNPALEETRQRAARAGPDPGHDGSVWWAVMWPWRQDASHGRLWTSSGKQEGRMDARVHTILDMTERYDTRCNSR